MKRLAKIKRMRKAFVSQNVWDAASYQDKYGIIGNVIQVGEPESINGMWSDAAHLVLGGRYQSVEGWDYSYQEMIAIFEMMERLAKLQAFQ